MRTGELLSSWRPLAWAYPEAFLPHNPQPAPHRALVPVHTSLGEYPDELARRRRTFRESFQQHKDAANCLETLIHKLPLSQALVTICNKAEVG